MADQIVLKQRKGNVNLDEINDVTLTTPSSGEALTYNGSAWVNTDIVTEIEGAAFLLKDGTRDLTGDWTIGTNNITLTSGRLTAATATIGSYTVAANSLLAYSSSASAIMGTANSGTGITCESTTGSAGIFQRDSDGGSNPLLYVNAYGADTGVSVKIRNEGTGNSLVLSDNFSDRFSITKEGIIGWWSHPYGAIDTNLYRDSANVLKTDDEFQAGSISTTGALDIGSLTTLNVINDTHIDWGTGANQVSALDIPIADAGTYFTGTEVETALQEIGETKFWNGYDLQTSASLPDLAFDDGSLTLTVSVQSGESNFYFWVDGKKVIKTTSQTSTISDVSGTYYFYFDNDGVLQNILEGNITGVEFYEYAITGIVYWNATAATGMSGNEKHGIRMSGATHLYNHQTYGARYEGGMNIEGLADGSATYTQTTSGYFWDEDIRHTISAQATHKFLYKLGALGEWTSTTAGDGVGYKEGGDTYYSWNQNNGGTWELTEGGSSTDYFITFFIATPNLSANTVYKIIGQNAYSSAKKARAAIETELYNLQTEGLPSPEFIFLYAVIVKRDGQLQELDDGSLYLDLRVLKGGVGGASSATQYHNDLINLNWASAGHTMDATLDMATNAISNVTTLGLTGAITISANTATITHSGATSLTIASTSGSVNIESVNFNAGAITAATSLNLISDTAYASSWNGVTTIAPSKNAVYDEMEQRSPTGVISAYAGNSAPTGWLICDGSAVSRTTYAALFAITSTTYGVGDGSTTFNVPDLKGKVPVGYSSGESEFDAMAETGGAKTHTLTITEMPAHDHPMAYNYSGANGVQNFRGLDGGQSWTVVPIGNTGGGEAHNNLQPYLTINYIIKT